MDLTNQQNGQQLILSEQIYENVSKILDELQANVRPETIVFCESNGYPVTHKGNMRGLDLAAISSLAANNFSATSRMASMLGEAGSFKFLFHEGEQNNLYISNVGFNFILVVIFDKDTALGMVRIFTKKAIAAISSLLKSAKDDESKAKEFFDMEFKTLLGEELNRSFGN